MESSLCYLHQSREGKYRIDDQHMAAVVLPYPKSNRAILVQSEIGVDRLAAIDLLICDGPPQGELSTGRVNLEIAPRIDFEFVCALESKCNVPGVCSGAEPEVVLQRITGTVEKKRDSRIKLRIFDGAVERNIVNPLCSIAAEKIVCVAGLEIAAFRSNFRGVPLQLDTSTGSSLTREAKFYAIWSEERADAISVHEKLGSGAAWP
jgi:hypothetical protein